MPPVSASEPAPQPEPAPAALLEPAPQPEPIHIDARKALEDDGLVMIETDRSKAVPVPPLEEEPVRLGRPRRERPRPLPQDEELQQVETKH